MKDDQRRSNRIDRRVSWFLALNALAWAGGFVALSGMAGQDMNWDLLNYHYYNPFAWLHDRWAVDIQPAQRQSFFSPYLDVPLFWLSERFGMRDAGAAIAVVQGLKAPFLFLLAWRLASEVGATNRTAPWVAQLLTVVAMVAPGHLAQVGTSFGDSLTATLVLAGVALLVFGMTARQDRGNARLDAVSGCLVTAGLILGVATGLKLTNAPYLVAGACAALPLSRAYRDRGPAVVFVGIGGLFGFLLSYGPWGMKLWAELGNPFFPQFNNLFASDFVGQGAYTDNRFDPPTMLHAVLYPWFYNPFGTSISRQQFGDLRMALALLAIPVFAWLSTRRGWSASSQPVLGASVLLVFSAVAYGLWLTVFPVVRYVMVLELLVPVLLLAALGLYGHWGKARSAWLGVLIIAMIASAVPSWSKPYPWGPRRAWADTPFEVSWPAGMPLDGALVIVAGGEAMSFLVPSAPASARFVRTGGNIRYDQGYQSLAQAYDNGLGRTMTEAISGHSGRFYVLYAEGEAGIARDDAEFHGLAFEESACEVIRNRFRRPLLLCSARRRSMP